MPTISQLPLAAQVTAADEIPLSQGGIAHSVSVGTLLASVQPAVVSATGTLLGRVSLGSGGPEAVAVGQGLLLNNGTLVASAFNLAGLPEETVLTPTDNALLNSNGLLTQLPLSSLRGLFSPGANISINATGTISATTPTGGSSGPYSIVDLTPVTTIASSDWVGISQGGTNCAITYQNFLDGQTIDAAGAAAPASDTDAFWVGQGSSTMLAQTFAKVWTWIKTKLPTYRRPVVEIIADTTLDGTTHNSAILVCSQPVTLMPAFINMGSGFTCSVVNLSSGNVAFGSGITTSSGSQILASGQAAELRAFTFSAGGVVFASIGGGGAPAQVPGPATDLSVGVATSSSVALTWQAPATGGTPTGYTANYRIASSGGIWTPQNATTTSLTVTGLLAATQYDFEIIANNAAGNGVASSIVTGTTQAEETQPPGQVNELTATAPTGSTVALSWIAPSTGGAVASYTAQYCVTGTTDWRVAAAGVTATVYTVTGLAASTSYDFEVFAVNEAGNGTASEPVSAATTTAVPDLPTGLTAGVATGTTVPLSWTTPASGGSVASYSVRSSPHNANTWTTVANISGTSTTIIGLTVSTSYDFQIEAVNAAGNSGWTATITAVTAGGGNYLLTAGFLPVAGSTWQVGQGGIGANVNDNSAAIDGNHTVPASVVFALSLSNSVVPVDSGHGAADLETASQFSNGGHNYWAAYMNAPTTTNNYYLWAIAKDTGANVVATFCLPSAYTVHT